MRHRQCFPLRDEDDGDVVYTFPDRSFLVPLHPIIREHPIVSGTGTTQRSQIPDSRLTPRALTVRSRPPSPAAVRPVLGEKPSSS